MKKPILFLIIITCLCGALLSVLLIFQHYHQAHELALVSMLCGDQTTGGCAKVNRSSYSELSGIPIAALGLTFYLSLALLIGLTIFAEGALRSVTLQIAFVAVGVAALADITLLIVQLVVIGAVCILCLATYACTVVLFLLLFSIGRKIRGETVSVMFKTATGKLLLYGWLIGSICIGFGSVAGSWLLAYQDPAKLEESFASAAINEFEGSPVTAIDLAGTPFKGTKDAPIKIVIFSDFLCPWCRQLAQTFQQHFAQWEGRVVIYYKNYPLDALCNKHNSSADHRGACFAALGGLCAEQQGRFWEYHDRTFERPPRDGRDRDIINIAREIGLDTVSFKTCLASSSMQHSIQRQVEEAHALGITGTPRIFINGKKLPKLSYLPAILASEAKRLGLAPLEGLNE